MFYQKILILCFLLFYSKMSVAYLYLEHNFNYQSSTDNFDQFSLKNMNNILFLGASLGKSQNWIIGQSAIFWSKTHKGGSGLPTSTLSLMELGPRLTWFLNAGLNFSLSVAYHPYAKGKRTSALLGQAEVLDGSSYLIQFTYLIEVVKYMYLGASISYHAIQIKTSVIDDVETKQTLGYNDIFPTLAYSFHF